MELSNIEWAEKHLRLQNEYHQCLKDGIDRELKYKELRVKADKMTEVLIMAKKEILRFYNRKVETFITRAIDEALEWKE
jgi:hypothetical protein